MSPTSNPTLILAAHPETLPVPGEHLVVKDIPLDSITTPPPGGIILKVTYVSFEPYLRGRMRPPNPASPSYIPNFELGGPISTFGLGVVIASDAADHPKDSIVRALLPVSQYAVIPAQMLPYIRIMPISTEAHGGPPDIRDWLGVLSVPGLTAYTSLYEIGKPKKGETILISSAAGGVGQIVGQLAKRDGLRVLGSVGSDEKLKFITEELGFDGGFNYKKESIEDGFKRLAPDGIDIYYDNVGGPHLSAALDSIRPHGRIVACGQISQYNLPPSEIHGVKNLMNIIPKCVTMTGFIVSDPLYMQHAPEFTTKMVGWLREGSVKTLTWELEGMEQAGRACVSVFTGENLGKAVLKI